MSHHAPTSNVVAFPRPRVARADTTLAGQVARLQARTADAGRNLAACRTHSEAARREVEHWQGQAADIQAAMGRLHAATAELGTLLPQLRTLTDRLAS